jgi:hypothetical protein
MKTPKEIEQAFEPYKFMLGVLIRAKLGVPNPDYIGVVIELDDGGRRILSAILQATALLDEASIAGDSTLMGLEAAVYVGLAPRHIVLAVLDKLEASATSAAFQMNPPSNQMHVVWKHGGHLFALFIQVGRPIEAPAKSAPPAESAAAPGAPEIALTGWGPPVRGDA